jgi:crotonobetaine/carnitine-CoA ligase
MILYVVLKSGEKLTPEQLIDWCQERLPKFAVPRYLEFLNELPKTPTERVEKYKLKERGIGPNTWDRTKGN